MYIRAKFINGRYYYYLVEAERIGGKIVQRSRAYLGAEEDAAEYAKEHGLKIVAPKPKIQGQGSAALVKLITAKKERLDSLRISPEVEKKYREDLAVVWTYNSTTIEGSTLTFREADLFLSEGIVGSGKPFKDYLDVKGHKDAVDLVFLWSDSDPKRRIIELDILNLHKTAMWGRNWGGAYRKVQVYIRGSAHLPLPPSQVKQAMNAFIERINKKPMDMSAIAWIAILHSVFEGIHPFVDGNGRVGRLMVNWMLLRESYPPIVIEAREKKRYFSLLEEAQTLNDPTRLIWFFNKKLNQAYDFYLNRVDPDYPGWLKKLKGKLR